VKVEGAIGDAVSFDVIKRFIGARGPDSQRLLIEGVVCESSFERVSQFKTVYFSSVLHLRGDSPHTQPF
jgi:hypothetical protein